MKFPEPHLQTKTALHAKALRQDDDQDDDVVVLVKTLAQNVRGVLAEAKDAHTKHSETLSEHNSRIFEIEQKQARRPGGNGGQAGESESGIKDIIDSPAFEMFKNGQTPRARIPLDQGFMSKAALVNATGQNQPLVPSDRKTEIRVAPLRRLTIRNLLRNETTTSNLVEYTRELEFINNAGPQFAAGAKENVLKNESGISFELVQDPVVTLAHWLPASKQILDDAPKLQSFIGNRLLQGLKIKEEDQLLNGDGKLGNLAGLLKPGNFTAFNNDLRQKGDTKIDVIRRAILQLQLAERDPTGVVLNPTDWADIELQKDSTGQYIWVDVTTGGESKVWRLAVVPTNAIAAGNFLVGDFPAAAVVYDRQEATIEISREHGDNFVKNMVTILVEERLGMAVEAPGALVYGPFTAP